MSSLQGTLLSFEKALGLKINLHKSAMAFSRNVAESSQMELAETLEVVVVSKHKKYLGLPTVEGCSKKVLFEGIKDRIWCKLHSWSAKKLSQEGCAVLLMSVLQTIPTFCYELLPPSEFVPQQTREFHGRFFLEIRQ
ncbi:UNVERIFIED_CONTAM: hypothetical protein Sradi_3982600 [Sesamum radiatum]|uniref:Uncharacterized protein n=1 Tax=Sesamum radiatum TaxID=300843 RepID=A0AAW2PHJ6_SESRA